MREANALADIVAGLLTRTVSEDGGAQFSIVVTDAAGNAAEITYHGALGWMAEDGVNLEQLATRLRMIVERGGTR